MWTEPFSEILLPVLIRRLLQLARMPMMKRFTGDPGRHQSGLVPVFTAAESPRQGQIFFLPLKHRVPRSSDSTPTHECWQPADSGSVN